MAVSVARDNRIFLQFPYLTIELTTYKHRNGRFHLFGEHLVENWHPIVHLSPQTVDCHCWTRVETQSVRNENNLLIDFNVFFCVDVPIRAANNGRPWRQI